VGTKFIIYWDNSLMWGNYLGYAVL